MVLSVEGLSGLHIHEGSSPDIHRIKLLGEFIYMDLKVSLLSNEAF